MRIVLAPLLATCIAAGAASPQTANPASDAPEGPRRVAPFKDVATYDEALQTWRSPEDVDAWIGAKFGYDMARAMRLAENQRRESGQLPIHPPREFFAAPSGICVDLSRFAVETLRRIDPALNASYLMIEFAPLTVAGNTLRRHWLASFTREGKHYFFADSKRPGHVAGPYSSVREFVDEYASYRNRPVVAFRELATYQRRQRAMAVRENRDEQPPDRTR